VSEQGHLDASDFRFKPPREAAQADLRDLVVRMAVRFHVMIPSPEMYSNPDY